MDVRELAQKLNGKSHGFVKFKVINHVVTFIKKYNISAGQTRVPMYKIYYEYYYWSGLKRTKKIDPIQLGKQLTKYFDKTRSGMYRYYLLDVPNFDMSKEALKKAKKFYKIHYGKKRKNKKNIVKVKEET